MSEINRRPESREDQLSRGNRPSSQRSIDFATGHGLPETRDLPKIQKKKLKRKINRDNT